MPTQPAKESIDRHNSWDKSIIIAVILRGKSNLDYYSTSEVSYPIIRYRGGGGKYVFNPLLKIVQQKFDLGKGCEGVQIELKKK